MDNEKLLVLVCTGNICRSPMAEAILSARLGSDSGWSVTSAGTMGLPGYPASEEARQAVAEIGLSLSGHRSKAITAELVERADLLVTMTKAHAAQVIGRFPVADKKTRLLSSFGSDTSFRDIADPIGYPLSVYRQCRDEIESAIADLILYLRQPQKGASS